MKKATLLLLVTSFTALWMLPTGASSHREAPLISGDPRADNTDVYAFVSPDRPDTVTIIANYIPLEEPAGGPNFHSFDDNVLYEIHVDSNGNARADVTYQFRFRTKVRNPNTFLYNTGPIDSLSDPDWNMPQTYEVTEVRREVEGHRWARTSPTPPVNIGPRSTPSYDTLRAAAVHSLSNGIKVFAGQVDDPFFVDLGSVFDLAGLRPFNRCTFSRFRRRPAWTASAASTRTRSPSRCRLTRLTQRRAAAHGAEQTRTRCSASTRARAAERCWIKEERETDRAMGRPGHFVQVSRLGNPLINEVVIPLGQKDRWNRSDPDRRRALPRQIYGARGDAARELPRIRCSTTRPRRAETISSRCC